MTSRFTITASRWPWQTGYNWHGVTNSTAPLNQPGPGDKAAPRFGGGWKYKLGFYTGGLKDYGWSLNFDLLFGIVSIQYRTPKAIAEEKARAERYKKLRETTAFRNGVEPRR